MRPGGIQPLRGRGLPSNELVELSEKPGFRGVRADRTLCRGTWPAGSTWQAGQVPRGRGSEVLLNTLVRSSLGHLLCHVLVPVGVQICQECELSGIGNEAKSHRVGLQHVPVGKWPFKGKWSPKLSFYRGGQRSSGGAQLARRPIAGNEQNHSGHQAAKLCFCHAICCVPEEEGGKNGSGLCWLCTCTVCRALGSVFSKSIVPMGAHEDLLTQVKTQTQYMRNK